MDQQHVGHVGSWLQACLAQCMLLLPASSWGTEALTDTKHANEQHVCCIEYQTVSLVLV